MANVDRELAAFVAQGAIAAQVEAHNRLAKDPVNLDSLTEELDPKVAKELEKVRKGAYGFIKTWKKLESILSHLGQGWKLEPIVGLVEVPRGGYYVGDEQGAVKERSEVSKDLVSSMPTNPRHGQRYVMGISDIESFQPAFSGGGEKWKFTYKLWWGAEGWRIHAPNGKYHDTLPSWTSFPDKMKPRKNLPLYDVLSWLNKNTDWKKRAADALGMGEHVPAQARSRAGTGTCPVCFQNIKAKPRMVLHGYKRPGYGMVEGNCLGVGELPFEVSPEGTKKHLKRIQDQIRGAKQRLADLKSGKVKILPQRRGPAITPDSNRWDTALRAEIANADGGIRQLSMMEDAFKKLVKNWKERPLPEEGAPHIDWYTRGQRPGN